MDDSAQKCKENTPPIFILLPVCFEAKTDLFFNVLRNAVSRGRMQNNFLESALISGMTGEKFQIDSDDPSVDWATLTSESEQIWQSKLLGCWATRHFPSIGKKMISAAWQPPKRFDVRLSGSTEMSDEEIDTIIFKKMKLRIIELNVSLSTQVAKLKYFVRAPATIGKINVTIISPKMRAFDIANEFLEECWKALKVGEFPSTVNFEQQSNSISTLKPSQPSIVACHLAIGDNRINRKDADVSFDEAPTDKSYTTRLSSKHKSISPPPFTAKMNVLSETTITPAAKRVRLVGSPNGDSNFDALQKVVFEMRNDIEKIAKWLDPNDNEAINGPERLHLTIFKQKDAEISKLRASLQSVRKDNELLETAKTQLHNECGAKSDLISALQKVVDANSKLHEKTQEESNVLAQKLSAADQIIIELTETNRNLHDDINAAKSQCGNMESSSQIHILNDTIHKLREEVNATKIQSASIESNFQSEIQNLAKQLSEAEDKEIESTDTIRRLREELNAVKIHSASIESNFQSEIQNFAKQLSEAEEKKTESENTIRKLSGELNTVKSRSTSIESNLGSQIQDFQSQIQKLIEQLSEANNIKTEMINANRRLQEELNSAKNKLEENDKLEEALNDAKLRFNDLLCELQVQIGDSEKITVETEKTNAELAVKNGKLQEELDALKQDGIIKDNELSLLKSSLESQQVSKIKTDSMKTPHITDGCNEVGTEKEKLSSAGQQTLESAEREEMELEEQEISEPLLKPDDTDFMAIRENLLKCRFGWIKFYKKINTRYPGFVHPTDADGFTRAQKVTSNGSVTMKTYKFFAFNENIPDSDKKMPQVKALNKLNKHFNFTFE